MTARSSPRLLSLALLIFHHLSSPRRVCCGTGGFLPALSYPNVPVMRHSLHSFAGDLAITTTYLNQTLTQVFTLKVNDMHPHTNPLRYCKDWAPAVIEWDPIWTLWLHKPKIRSCTGPGLGLGFRSMHEDFWESCFNRLWEVEEQTPHWEDTFTGLLYTLHLSSYTIVNLWD